MVHIAFDLDAGVLARFPQEPDFTRELRGAAAVKGYELRRVSQGRAAEIAGLTRAAFIDALGTYGVSPFQETVEELDELVGAKTIEPSARDRQFVAAHL